MSSYRKRKTPGEGGEVLSEKKFRTSPGHSLKVVLHKNYSKTGNVWPWDTFTTMSERPVIRIDKPNGDIRLSFRSVKLYLHKIHKLHRIKDQLVFSIGSIFGMPDCLYSINIERHTFKKKSRVKFVSGMTFVLEFDGHYLTGVTITPP